MTKVDPRRNYFTVGKGDNPVDIDYIPGTMLVKLLRPRRDLENIPPWERAERKLLKEFTYPKGPWTEHRFNRLLKEVADYAAYHAVKKVAGLIGLRAKVEDESESEEEQRDLEALAALGSPNVGDLEESGGDLQGPGDGGDETDATCDAEGGEES